MGPIRTRRPMPANAASGRARWTPRGPSTRVPRNLTRSCGAHSWACNALPSAGATLLPPPARWTRSSGSRATRAATWRSSRTRAWDRSPKRCCRPWRSGRRCDRPDRSSRRWRPCPSTGCLLRPPWCMPSRPPRTSTVTARSISWRRWSTPRRCASSAGWSGACRAAVGGWSPAPSTPSGAAGSSGATSTTMAAWTWRSGAWIPRRGSSAAASGSAGRTRSRTAAGSRSPSRAQRSRPTTCSCARTLTTTATWTSSTRVPSVPACSGTWAARVPGSRSSGIAARSPARSPRPARRPPTWMATATLTSSSGPPPARLRRPGRTTGPAHGGAMRRLRPSSPRDRARWCRSGTTRMDRPPSPRWWTASLAASARCSSGSATALHGRRGGERRAPPRQPSG